MSTRYSTFTLALTMLAAGCHVREARVAIPTADYEAQLVRSRVEAREGKKKPTWKPIVLGVLAGVTAGSVAMMWVGFLQPNRPLAVTGIVLVSTVPTLGSIPFLLEQDQPWTKTEWEAWKPMPGTKATLDVLGRDIAPLSTLPLVADAEGNLHVPLQQLCDAPRVRELQLVDVMVRAPAAAAETATVPVDRLPEPCGGGRLSLLHPQYPQEEQEEEGGEHVEP